MTVKFNPSTTLEPGQKVRVVLNVDVAFDVDISSYLEEYGDSDITVNDLESDIVDNLQLPDILDEYDNVEISPVEAKVTEIELR